MDILFINVLEIFSYFPVVFYKTTRQILLSPRMTISQTESSSCSQESSHKCKFNQVSRLRRRHDCVKSLIFKE